MTGIFRKLRRALALMLACMMLASSVASAAPTLTLPSMLTVIEDEAFKGDTSIENVVIPDGVTTIGVEAFEGCTSLQTVTIPDSVTAIGANAFQNCGDVVIICSSTSYAAEYAIEYALNTQFTDAAAIEMEWEQSIFTAYPADQGGMFGCVVLLAAANGYDEAVYGEISWTLERIDENEGEPVSLYLVPNGQYAAVRLNEWSATEGEATYRLTFAAGAFTESHEFTVAAASMPEDIPTDIGMHQTEFAVGDTLDFGKDDLYFVDGGFSMEDACVALSIPGIEEWPVWTENEAEFTDDGFHVTFTKEGSYLIPAWVLINNALCYEEIAITVGSGVSEESFLEVNASHTTLYLQGDDGRDCWLAEMGMANFENVAGLPVEWQLETIAHDGEEPPVYAYINSSEDGPWGSLHVERLTGSAGSVTFRVHCIVNGVDFWQDVTFTVEELPETMPSDEDVQVPQTEYTMNVGDVFEFKTSDIGLDESLLPEGMTWIPEIHNTWMLEQNSDFEWTEEGFRTTFTEDGRFVFRAVAKLGANVYIGRDITVTVGTGVSPDFDIAEEFVTDTLYVGGHDSWIISVGISGYTPPAGTDLTWVLEQHEGQENPVVEAFVNGEASDGEGNYEIMVNANPMSDQPGEATWILKAVAGEEIVYERELVLKLVEVPADMNLDMTVAQTVFNASVGEVFHYDFANIQKGDSFNAPEDATVLKITYLNEHFWDNESFSWVDGGFEITFDEPGRYMFESGVQVSNYTNVEQIVIIVEEGPELNMNWASDVLFNTMEGSAYIGELHLDNFFLHDGEYVNWTYGQISGDADVRLYIDDAWDEGRSIALRAELNSDANGTAVFEISAHGFDGTEYTTQLVIAVMDGNVELPGSEAISVPQETYELNVGDSLTFTVDDFTFDATNVPEGYYYSKEVWGDDRIDQLEDFEWIDGGFTVAFTEEGRYEFRAAVRYSADCAVWKNIYVTVGNGGAENAALQCNYYVDALYPAGGERMQSSYELTGYNILSSDEVEWKLERYTDEHSPAEPITTLYISWTSDDNRSVDITATVPSEVEEFVAEEYDLICCINGVEVTRERIFANVYPTPENLPTELWVEWDQLIVDQGHEVYFGYDHFDVADSDNYAGPEYRKEIWLGGFEEFGEFEWLEEGFRFVPHTDGVYSFTAAVLVGNYTVERQISIIVGAGVDTEYSVNWDDNAFVLYRGHGENWMTNAFVNDYDLPGGWEIEWNVYPVDGEAYQPINVWLNDTQDSGRFAGFSMNENGEECGEAVWRIEAIVNGQIIAEREITVYLADLPEDIPTELWVAENTDNYIIAVGEEFVFTHDMFDVNNGTEPEGVLKRKELWVSDYLQNAAGFEWTENGIRFVPEHDGRYTFEAVVRYGSHCATRWITVTVGSGVHPEFGIEWEENSSVIFKDHEWTWIANAFIRNYAPPAGCDIEWRIERVTADDNQLVNLRFADIWDNNLSASIHGDPMSDQSGEEVWHILAQAGEEVLIDCDITVTLADLPETMPTDIDIDNDDIHIEVGEEFVFDTTMFEVGEGVIPDGTRAYKFVDVPENVYNIYGFDWTENGGFYVKPDRDGRFNFKAAVEIGNYRIYRTITVTVGTGEDENFGVDYSEGSFTIFRNYEHSSDMWVMDAYIHDYTPPAGCEIEWRFEYQGEAGTEKLEPYFGNIWDDNRSANISVRILEHELGDETWRVVAMAGEEELFSREFTITIADLPENMPSEMWINCDYFEINPGDEFYIRYDSFGIESGEVPEGMKTVHEFWTDDSIQNENEFEWLDEGFRFRPMQDGTYTFEAAIRIANYAVSRPVTVKVGSGVNPNFGVDWDEGSFTMYTGQNHDMWVMDAHIHDYTLPEGAQIEWYVEQGEFDGGWETEAYIGNVWDDGMSANISVRFADPDNQYCAADNWRVIAKVGDEVIVERDFQICIADAPEGLPTGLNVTWDYLEIEPGTEVSMTNDDFDLADGAMPEGERVDKEFWLNPQIEEANGFEWIEGGGFRFAPTEEGYYAFRVAVKAANITVDRQIVIKVGSGVRADQAIDFDRNSTQLYKGGHDVWVMDVYMSNSVEGLDWTLTRENEEETLYVEPFFVWVESDGWGNYSLRVNANQMSDESGSNTWYLRASLGDQVLIEEMMILSLVDYPEEGQLNIDVAATEVEFRVALGEIFSYAFDNVQEGDDFVKPGDAGQCSIIYLNDSITNNESFTWTETGFDVVFTEPGRYAFEHGIQVNNYTETVWITVIVGDEPSLDVHCKSDVVLSTSEGGSWFAYVTLNDFHLVNDEWVEWKVEPVTENPVVELYVDNTGDGGRGANVHTRNLTGEAGEATFRIIAYGWDGREYSAELTVYVIDAAELEMPGSEIIQIEQDYYHLDVGTDFNLSADCFTVDESLLPEGFGCYKELWGNDRIDGLGGAYWDDNGFHVNFGIEGRFELTAAVWITSDYIVTRPIVIEVGEVSTENAALECHTYVNAIYPSDSESHIASYSLTGYDLLSADDVQWRVVRYTDEYSPETPIVDMRVGWISENRDFVDVFVGATHGEYATELYNLICEVNGEEIASVQIEANVVEMPESMPTELRIDTDNDRYYINPWDVFEFHTSDFDIANGSIPEGVYTVKEVWVDGDLHNTNGFEWLEDGGFRVQPDHDATYTFTAVVKIGNHCVTRDVMLIVGAGDNSNYWVDWQDHADELYLNNGDITVSGVYINDYTLPEGMEVEWDIFRVDDDPNQVIWLEARDHRDGGLGVNLIAGQDNGDCGMNTWRVIARVGDEELLNRDFTLFVNEMPENMPSNEALWVDCAEYELNVGDTLDFNDSLFDLVEGDYDMGGWWKEVHVPEEWNELGVEWYDHNAFRVTFNEDGRYTFRVAMLKSNFSISREITITVGTGVPADAGLDVRRYLSALYVGENENLSDSCDGVNVRLKGYNRFEDEEIQWDISNVAEDGEYCVEAQIGGLSEDGLDADIEFFNINAVGEETFKVTASTGSGAVYETEFTITVTDDLSALPTDFEIDISDHYEIGDSYCFNLDSVTMEGKETGFQFHHDMENIFGNDGNDVWWDDNGLNITFWTENTLEIPFRFEFGNYALEKTYVVSIGDGVRDDAHIHLEQNTNTVYIGGNGGSPIAWARLNNYTLLTDEEVTWTLTRVNGSGSDSSSDPMELCFGDFWEKNWQAHIHVRNLTGEEGWVEYELTGTADRYSQTHTIWVQVVNAPENLPTEIWLENDAFELQVGEQLVLNTDFWANGEVPEDAYVSLRYELSDGFMANADVEWREDGGFTATMNADGRYTLTAFMEINNYVITRDIVVVVGDGYNEDMGMEVEQHFFAGFNYSDDQNQHCIATACLNNYQPASGEEISWTVELTDPTDGTAPVELVLGGVSDGGLTANIDMCNPTGATGTVTYKVTARTGFGQEFSADITYEILDVAQYSLPTELTGVETEVHREVGETYEINPAEIGMEGGEVPESLMGQVYLQYWDGFEYLEWLPGFEWHEDDDGFNVTFNRDGYFEYRIGYRIGTNHFVYKDVAITVGEGLPADVNPSGVAYSDYVLTGTEPGTELRYAEFRLDGYTPYEGEKIEWQLIHLEGDQENVSLHIEEVMDDGLAVRVNIVAGYCTAGETVYGLGVVTESGYSFDGPIYAYVFDRSEMAVNSAWVDDINISVGEEFVFIPEEQIQLDGSYSDALYYTTEIIPDEMLASQAGYSQWYDFDVRDEVFSFTPESEGRYAVTVRFLFGSEVFEDSFILTVGDGVSDDVCITADQHTETIYLGGGENYLIGSVVLNNYNFIGDEWAYWSIERIDENEGSPVELYLNRRQSVCTVGFRNIQSTGSVTYRVTVQTDAGFTDYMDFTLNVVEMPETLPTGFDFTIPTYYEIGETLRFDGIDSISLVGGEAPEGAVVDAWVIDLQDNPIWHENECSSGNGWFEANLNRNGRYSVGIRVKISNYVMERMLDITVGTGVSDDVHIGQLDTEGWFYPNQGDSWVGDFYLNEYNLLSGETVEWTWERVEGDIDPELYIADSWDGGLRMKLNLSGTGEECGWANYVMTVRTSGGYEQSCEFHLEVYEMPENMPANLNGPDEIILMPNETFEFNAEWYVQPEWESPDGNRIRYAVSVDDAILNSEGFGGWMDDGWIIFTPTEEGEYVVTVHAQIGNYTLNEKQITLNACFPEIELYNAGSVVYTNADGDELWVADATLVNIPEQYQDQVEWSLEMIGDYSRPSLYMHLGDAWDDGRSINVFAGYEDIWYDEVESITYRLTARIGEVFEESVELTVTQEYMSADLPYDLDMGDIETDVQLNVGDTYTFDSTLISFGEGTVPEGAFVRDEIWGLEDGIEYQDNFQSWENNMGIDGAGFSVTFNNPGRYHFYAVKVINNHKISEEIRITVGEPDMTNLPMEFSLTMDTLYTECDMVPIGWWKMVDSNEFTFFDTDTVEWTFTRVTDENSSAEAAVSVEESWIDNGAIDIMVSETGTATGTETYRMAFVINGVEAAVQEITLNVVEKPEGMPEYLIYSRADEAGYSSDGYCRMIPASPGCFTVRLDEFTLSEGTIPEGVEAQWFIHETHDEDWHTVVWHEDGRGLDIHYEANDVGTEARIYVSVLFNNCEVWYRIELDVDGGIPK